MGTARVLIFFFFFFLSCVLIGKDITWVTLECARTGGILKRVSILDATRLIEEVVSTVMKCKNLVVNSIRTKHGNYFVHGLMQVMDMEEILRKYHNELELKVWYERRKNSRVCK